MKILEDESILFLTNFRENGDFSYQDEIEEAKQLGLRNRLIEQAIRGEIEFDIVLDCLFDQGIDPIQWAQDVADNCEFVIENGIRFRTESSGLFLPG